MLLATDNNLTTYAVLAAMVVAVWLLLWWTQRSMARSSSSPRRRFGSRDEEEPQSSGQREIAPVDFTRWEVEMHDLMRSATGQIDSKMGLLEHLIREADRAAARLEAAMASASPAERPADSSNSSSQGSQGQGGNQAEALRSESPGAASIPPEDESDRPGKPRRYEEIYTLSDYGYGASEIAQRLAMPIGEIELILGLRPQR